MNISTNKLVIMDRNTKIIATSIFHLSKTIYDYLLKRCTQYHIPLKTYNSLIKFVLRVKTYFGYHKMFRKNVEMEYF